LLIKRAKKRAKKIIYHHHRSGKIAVAACKQEGVGLQTRRNQAQIKMQISRIPAQIRMQTACKQELRLKLKCK
jgi:ATP-dependent Clp protease adapter protein ClpS